MCRWLASCGSPILNERGALRRGRTRSLASRLAWFPPAHPTASHSSLVGVGLDDGCVPARLLESASQSFDHVGIGFGERKFADGLWVVLEVQPRAGTELKCSSACLC